MRIAYVINSVEGGGAAAPVPAVTGVLRGHGAEVKVFALTRRDGRGLPAMQEAGLSVQVRQGGKKDHFAAYAWLERQLRAWKPDLIWTSLTRATLLGQLAGRALHTPVVSWQHAAFLKPANRLLLRATQEASVMWIGDSHSVAALTADRLAVPPERLAVWPLFSADPLAPQARPWRPGETLQLGSLGRLHPVKGYDVLIAALARLKAEGFRPPCPFSIRIAGDGEQRAALTAAAASAGIEGFELIGFESRPRAFLASLHLYLQPSRSEGLCIAAHEAMQAGLPTIVSAVGEMPYSVVAGETGLVVPPSDPVALADALAKALAEPAALGAMGRAARARVLERFGAEAFEQAGAEVLSRLAVMGIGDGAGARRRSPVPAAIGRSA